MKKFFEKIFASALILILLFSGCSGMDNAVNTEQNLSDYVEGEDYQNFLSSVSAMAKAPNGYYYFNDLMLYYFDEETKEAYPVCNKPNCNHQTAGCMAFFNLFQYHPFMLSYYENALYVWGWEEDGSTRHNYIYEISLDNYKRKKAAFLFDGTSSGSIYYIIHRGYIYYIKSGGTDLKQQTACLYRVKIGNTSTKKEEEIIYEYSGIGAEIWGLTASGNRLFILNSSYGDTEGNGYATSYSVIDIHSLESETLVGNGAYSLFADGNYVYYGKDENTIYRIDLTTKEETFFCEIYGPCYISADSNYIYFDNLQAIYIDETDEKNRKITVCDKNGNYVTEVIPQEPKDECYFGDDDYMFFKGMSAGKVYAFDKSQLAFQNRQFIHLQ